MRSFTYSSLVLLVALSGGSSALWGTIIYENDLPNAVTKNGVFVNNPAGANAANISWLSGFEDNSPSVAPWDILGDDFSFSSGATVNTITVYEIANTACPTAACNLGIGASAPGTEFSSISLYAGPATGTLSLETSTYTATQVFYSAGVSYEDPSGDYFPIYALTFNLPTPLLAQAGQDYAFAVDGVVSATELAADSGAGLFLSAVNAADALASSTTLRPVIEDAANNAFYYYQESAQGASTAAYLPLPGGPGGNPYPGLCDTAPGTTNFCSGVWNKSSVLNVQITGTLLPATPEPGTIFLTCLGILAFAFRKRSR